MLSSLHNLGIYHGDLNKHNFLVQPSRAYLINFEASRKVDDQQELALEREGLEETICSDSRRGENYVDYPEPQA